MNYNENSNIQIIRVPEGEEKEGGAENILEEIMTENSLNLTRDIDLQIPLSE